MNVRNITTAITIVLFLTVTVMLAMLLIENAEERGNVRRLRGNVKLIEQAQCDQLVQKGEYTMYEWQLTWLLPGEAWPTNPWTGESITWESDYLGFLEHFPIIGEEETTTPTGEIPDLYQPSRPLTWGDPILIAVLETNGDIGFRIDGHDRAGTLITVRGSIRESYDQQVAEMTLWIAEGIKRYVREHDRFPPITNGRYDLSDADGTSELRQGRNVYDRTQVEPSGRIAPGCIRLRKRNGYMYVRGYDGDGGLLVEQRLNPVLCQSS